MKKTEATVASRQRILEAAIEEFGDKGYKQGSTNSICETLGISKGIIFYHFSSKEKLFQEAVVLCMEEFDCYMHENFVRRNDPLEGIRECCKVRKEFFSRKSAYLRMFVEVLYGTGERENEITAKLRESYEKHTYDILDKILQNETLNQRISRNENIWMAVKLIEQIDMEMAYQYRTKKEKQKSQQTEPRLEENVFEEAIEEQVLEEQMKRYEGYLEALLYGILER